MLRTPHLFRHERGQWRSERRGCSLRLIELRENAVSAEWQAVEPDPGSVGKCVAKGRCDRDNRGFAGGFRAERAVAVVRVREENLSSRNVGESGDAVVAKSRIDHFPVLIEDP